MKHIAITAVAVLALAGAARAEEAAELFAKRCAVCHGKDGKGDTPMAKRLGAKDLTATRLSRAEIAKVIAGGKGKMTPFKGRMSDAEIEAVAAYVKSGLK